MQKICLGARRRDKFPQLTFSSTIQETRPKEDDLPEAGTMGSLIGKGYLPCRRCIGVLSKEHDGRGRLGYLGNDKIPVIERSVVEVDEDLVVGELRHQGVLVELEAVEAIFGCEGPLLSSRRRHCEEQIVCVR